METTAVTQETWHADQQLRARKGWTQEALAEKVGVSRVHLANVESDESAANHRTPSLALLDKLAKAFKVSVADLLK